MGGHSFEPEGLATPRIPTSLYNILKQEYAAALSPFYHRTAHASTIPTKPDHGDVDILASGPLPHTTPAAIAASLNAAAFKRNGAVTNYAIPHPTTPSTFVQLDVQECPPGYLDWQLFQASYGDLAQILGVVHRPLGLTATDRGLHVRMAAIEKANRKASLVHLSHEPRAVLAFFGLDPGPYERAEFGSEEEVFAWVAGGRFFDRYAVVPRRGGGGEEEEKRPESENHNDRARRAKRGMYRRFVEEWVPAHPEAGAACAWTREAVLEEALDVFGKRAEHDERLAEYRLATREEELWRAIKEKVPRKGVSLALVVRGLKRWVRVEGGTLALCDEPLLEEKKPWLRHMGENGEEEVLKWVEEHWVEVQVKEKAFAALKKTQGLGLDSTSDLQEKEAKRICLGDNISAQ
ncbi:uncharacterized protein LTHEOB_6310 [Lasiodiplodia theobromae]|uniref:uncharacterized protein n=1 Tax=Lasiodiplodia theobromae TaxID=45133 RepID=UPI0015C33505|nr:uncharacterized protein LTHEOB_6310 [Lasiodiplodia theobromae]KAF4544192.1 hypothetical protein LTHEOB_6310 [Lasiodiplodia theobromae]